MGMGIRARVYGQYCSKCLNHRLKSRPDILLKVKNQKKSLIFVWGVAVDFRNALVKQSGAETFSIFNFWYSLLLLLSLLSSFLQLVSVCCCCCYYYRCYCCCCSFVSCWFAYPNLRVFFSSTLFSIANFVFQKYATFSFFFLIIHHVQYFGWLDRTDIIAVFVHVDGVGTPMGGQQSGQNCENGDFYNPY